tara:strand:+ start:17555 stop:18865 length:1311 start_codon:yes stop_codon:yes gene_type:complete
MDQKQHITIFWHRRDLRLNDNAGAYHALKQHQNVLPIFIFDTSILNDLEEKDDRRVTFIHQALKELKIQLEKQGSSIRIFHTTPQKAFEQLLSDYSVDAVYTNRDYEPAAQKRDDAIADMLKKDNIAFHTYKDQCIFEKNEVVKNDGDWYSVFTPYSRKWKEKITGFYLKPYPNKNYFNSYIDCDPFDFPTLEKLGFTPKTDYIPSSKIDEKLLENYHETRDIPSIKGTTHISVHLRFGTVSIRKMAQLGYKHNETWLNELIWRDFYMMILHHNPQVVTKSFKPKYDNIKWRNNEEEFQKWCAGETGYPIVDAGMRELNTTGFMHNRVRMVTASFLVKHLLIDWRWGEAYFAKKLIDFELASNNGGWQWAAGSGCDAAPYFRVFNPELQTKKFDPELKYIRKWVPEFQELSYQQKRIVEHKAARERALSTYKSALD